MTARLRPWSSLRSRSRSTALLVAGVVASIAVGLVSCVAGASWPRDSGGTPAQTPRHELGPEAKRVAEAITSVFENSTTELQYGYAEGLADGRGLTAGRAGFTSATGDLVVVVRRYVALRPTTPLAAYLPLLEDLSARRSADTDQLGPFVPLWEEAADDEIMRRVQDEVVDELYYWPAMTQAARIGAVLPLTLAVLYDTAIQHGNGTDPDGLAALVNETTRAMGGTPRQGVDERQWLGTFLSVRHERLLHAFNPRTREAWARSADRAVALAELATAGEWALEPPITLDAYGDTFTIDSGHSVS